MSKVQNSKPEAADNRSSMSAQNRSADFGPSTFDLGPDGDPGLRTLDVELSVTDLRKSFTTSAGERVEVLKSVSFTANAGEAIAIVGASGAGKSTLLHLLGGLDIPDHGSISAGELAIENTSAQRLARFRNQQVGFIFQFHHLLPDLTAVENVSLPLRIARSNTRAAMQRAYDMLAQVGLDRRGADSLVGRLSGGEQQRVAVCRALITNPRFVLADEPTGNLDTNTGADIARSLITHARDNRAVVIIATHNPALASICDRKLALRDGRILSN